MPLLSLKLVRNECNFQFVSDLQHLVYEGESNRISASGRCSIEDRAAAGDRVATLRRICESSPQERRSSVGRDRNLRREDCHDESLTSEFLGHERSRGLRTCARMQNADTKSALPQDLTSDAAKIVRDPRDLEANRHILSYKPVHTKSKEELMATSPFQARIGTHRRRFRPPTPPTPPAVAATTSVPAAPAGWDVRQVVRARHVEPKKRRKSSATQTASICRQRRCIVRQLIRPRRRDRNGVVVALHRPTSDLVRKTEPRLQTPDLATHLQSDVSVAARPPHQTPPIVHEVEVRNTEATTRGPRVQLTVLL